MLHTLANFIAIGQAADTDVTPVTDSVFLIQNGHFVPQQDIYLMAAAAMEATPSRVRLVTASLRIPSTPWLRPLITGVIPPNIPLIPDYRANPLVLKALEEIQVWATSALASGNENFTSLLFVSDAPTLTPSPMGNIVTMRGTATTAAVANAWTQLAVTWQDTLPNGTYGIVGLHHYSAHAQACRLIVNGQQWRPGCLSVNALGNYTSPIFHKGNLGLLGTFRSVAMPIPEVLCNAADATHEVYLEFVRMS